jgi:hypothetical protein
MQEQLSQYRPRVEPPLTVKDKADVYYRLVELNKRSGCREALGPRLRQMVAAYELAKETGTATDEQAAQVAAELGAWFSTEYRRHVESVEAQRRESALANPHQWLAAAPPKEAKSPFVDSVEIPDFPEGEF